MSKILTLENATRSEYGKELYDFRDVITHPLRWEDVCLVLTASSFSMNKDLDEKVSRAWEVTKAKNPNVFDAPKLRFEGVEWEDGVLMVYLSSGITYSQHNVIRNERGLPLTSYPTPMTINCLQETIDGFLLFGSRNPEISDQSGGAVIGAGFHDPLKGKEEFFPGGIFETALKEVKEETKFQQGGRRIEIKEVYNKKLKKHVKREIIVGGNHVIYPIKQDLMRAITLARGSNTDITMGFYVPLTVRADEVVLPTYRTDEGKEVLDNFEYDEIFRVRNDTKNLERALNTGNLEGLKTNNGFVSYSVLLADHPIGVVEAFLRLRDKLPRVGYHQH